MMPTVSVIVACHGSADHLESTLCSVLDQGCTGLQLIVVDGMREDHATATLRHYRHDIDLWIRQRCVTLAQTINLGLARAHGDIVHVLTPGQMLLHGTLQHVVDVMTRTEAAWLVGCSQRVDMDDRRLGLCESHAPQSLASFLMHDSGMLPMEATFWRRPLLGGDAALDESLHESADYELVARRLAQGHWPMVLMQPLAVRREDTHRVDPQAMLRRGREHVQVALRYAPMLSGSSLYALLRNCDHRNRIYALAEAELHGRSSRADLLKLLLRRPWWLMDEAIRHVLVHGGHQSAPSLKPAA